jgi:DNA-binding NarL/FixJ family response regulator
VAKRTRRAWEDTLIRGTGVSSPGPTRLSLSGGYAYAGADERSPREIVAALHAELARRCPDLAPRIAEYEQEAAARAAAAVREAERQAADDAARSARTTSAGRAGRTQDYAELIAQGFTQEDAAERMGVSVRTAERYESEIRRLEAAS